MKYFGKQDSGQAVSFREKNAGREFSAVFSALILLCGTAVMVVHSAVSPFAAFVSVTDPAESVYAPTLPSYPIEMRGTKKVVCSPYFSDKNWIDFTDYPVQSIPEKEEDSLPIVTATLSASEKFEKIGNIFLNNESEKKTNAAARTVESDGSSLPEVLIYHTHGTESYNPGVDFYGSYPVNSEDTEKNVVKVGEVIAEILEKRGIGVIHLTEMFDRDDYLSAYDRSLEAVGKTMKENPSVKIVIDVHRDTVIRSDGTKLSAIVKNEAGNIAQMMIVIGSGRKGAEVPEWNDNLSFALGISEKIAENYPDVLRPILIRATRYNQHVCPNSFLLEVGTCGNTLPEAIRAAVIFANSLADTMTK